MVVLLLSISGMDDLNNDQLLDVNSRNRQIDFAEGNALISKRQARVLKEPLLRAQEDGEPHDHL